MKVLSTQEQAIESGKKALYEGVTERVLGILNAIRNYGSPRLSVDRAVLFTESLKETEGQPLIIRWAKAVKHFAEHVPVTIFDGELIVGRPNTWLGKWGIVYAELDGSIMPAGVEEFIKNKGKIGEVVVTEEDRKIVNEILTPYWAGRDYGSAYHRELPEETRTLLFGPDSKNTLMWTLVIMGSSILRHSQNWTPDFRKILTKGCKGIREIGRAHV